MSKTVILKFISLFLFFLFFLSFFPSPTFSVLSVCDDSLNPTAFSTHFFQLRKHYPIISNFSKSKFSSNAQTVQSGHGQNGHTGPNGISAVVHFWYDYEEKVTNLEEMVEMLRVYSGNGMIFEKNYVPLVRDFKEIRDEGKRRVEIKEMMWMKEEDEFTMIQAMAESEKGGVVVGPMYNVHWELVAAGLREKSRADNNYFEYNTHSKHVPFVHFPYPYLKEGNYAEMIILGSNVKALDEKNVTERFKGMGFYELRKELKFDVHVMQEDHFITVIYLEDEMGRVVFMKEISENDVDAYDKLATFQFELSEILNLDRIQSLTAFEYCNKHGLYQGKLMMVPVGLSGKCAIQIED